MDRLADKFEGAPDQVLACKENPGQEFVKDSRFQMVLEDQPKPRWTSQSKMGVRLEFAS